MKQVLMAVAVTVGMVAYQARAEEVASQGAVAAQTAQDSQAAGASQAAQGALASKPAPTKTGNFWTGDAKLVVADHYSGAALPQPARVVIADFVVPAGDITVDDSLSARLHRRLMAHFGKDDDSSPEILAQHVQAAFFDGLSAELKKVNVPSDRATAGGATGGGATSAHAVSDGAAGAAKDAAPSELVISGQFTAIDEGNKTKRELIGLGRGASDIKTHVTITSVTAGRSTVVLEFDMSSESNKKPGAAITSASSLGVGVAEKAVGDRKSTVEADATRMGKLVAKQVEGLVSEQKWVYAPAVVTAANGSTTTPKG
jgi:3',5'-cyclic AMP phosphodiesterase CpdA